MVDKLHIISILIDKADKLIIGGKMAFTFLAAKGVPVGDTEIEESHRVEVIPLANIGHPYTNLLACLQCARPWCSAGYTAIHFVVDVHVVKAFW